MTGDVTINPSASALVMTTEVSYLAQTKANQLFEHAVTKEPYQGLCGRNPAGNLATYIAELLPPK